MKNCYLLIICISLSSNLFSQKDIKIDFPCKNDSSIIQIKAFYNGYGKIFRHESEYNVDYFGNKLPHSFPDYVKDYELSYDEIIEVELLLKENPAIYTHYHINGNLKSYYRQYISYINYLDDVIVEVNLMNFKNKRKAKKYFSLWNKSLSDGNGHFYRVNHRTITINLSKRTIDRL